MEQPRGRRFVWLRHGVETLLGLVLILVGYAILLALIGLFLWSVVHESPHRRSSKTGNGTVIAFLAVAVVVIAVPIALGHRLVGRSRRLVLFLRRFGYTEATHALTFAALTTIGRSWRLVTLDDAAVAPVGVSSPAAKLVAAGDRGLAWVGAVVGAIGALLFTALWGGVAGMGGVVGYWALHHHPVLATVGDALRRHHATHADAAGIFRICLLVTVVAFFAVLVSTLAAFAAYPLFQPWSLFSGAVHKAEQAKVTQVGSVDPRRNVAREVRGQTRKIFSPRLMVVQVANDVWRPTVKRFAEIASVVLIDVSVLTENLLWEIAEVVRDPSTACVLVGHAEGLRDLEVIDTPLERRLVELLDGRTILAYETTKPGMKRFARALRSALEVAV